MRLHEFTNLRPFNATVRLNQNKIMVHTRIWAESLQHARRLAEHQFGVGNVITVIKATELKEADKTIKPTDGKTQQINAIKQQTKQVKQQAKLTKAQQSLRSAQNSLRNAQARPK